MSDQTELLYGLNPAFETLRARRRHVERAYLLEGYEGRPRLAKLAGLLGKAGVRISSADKHRLHQLSDTRKHQGAVLEVSPFPYAEDEAVFGHDRLLLLDNIEDPQNTGAILRSADIFGFHGVLLPTKGVPPIYPSVVKASAGATEHLDISKRRTAVASLRAAQERGYRVASLDARGKTDIRSVPLAPDEPLLLVVGGEDKAVGRYILDQSDWVVTLGGRGRVNSLNASAAAAIAMHCMQTGSKTGAHGKTT